MFSWGVDSIVLFGFREGFFVDFMIIVLFLFFFRIEVDIS